MPETARVVLPLPVDQAYTYAVPADLAWVQPGHRVLVPFGPRRLTGLVVALDGDDAPPPRLKPLLDILDETPAFTGEMLRLTRWVADYYVCGWGEAARAALPPGTDIESRQHVVRTEVPAPQPAQNPTARAVLRHLEAHGETTLSSLRKAVPKLRATLLSQLEADGLVRRTDTLTRARVRVKREKHVALAEAHRSPEAVAALRVQLRGAKQIAVIEALAALAAEGHRRPRQADVLARAQAAAATLPALARRGIVTITEEEVLRSPLGDFGPPPDSPPSHTFHPGQVQALQQIEAAVAAERFETFLLHGVTGSGKTEVYIAALKAVLARGKTGIILVPEIALTPQTVQRFQAHFGDQIAVLHSRMSLGERFDAWRSLREGRFHIVIGPRSAVLAPLSNLGLIVVDEEHEHSYKQFDPAPRYHARDVAVMRAHMNDAVCVLGSATPSLESWTNAHWGKYTLLSMPQRVPVPGREAAPLPIVQVVDLALEKKKHRLHGAFSDTLREAIQARLDRREQVILLQNRRGYAPIIECEGCGWSPLCKDCSVTMTYHKSKHHLRCHYCGRSQRLPQVCPKCGSHELSLLGTGTQRVEEELDACFPDARVLRMDLDTTSRKGAHHRLLDRFGRGEADILLGTQMVAKGLDFGRVTLVGVINADMGLLLPDFRAEERTFQLLTQVAGRAGRARLKGEVLLQTRNPGHAVLRYACLHDYLGFVEEALPDRQGLGYPPFGRIVGIEFRGPREQEVEALAKRWTACLRQHLSPQQAAALQVLGPEPAFIGRVKRQYRFHTILKAPRNLPPAALQNLLRETNAAFGKTPKDLRVVVDVDAVALF